VRSRVIQAIVRFFFEVGIPVRCRSASASLVLGVDDLPGPMNWAIYGAVVHRPASPLRSLSARLTNGTETLPEARAARRAGSIAALKTFVDEKEDRQLAIQVMPCASVRDAQSAQSSSHSLMKSALGQNREIDAVQHTLEGWIVHEVVANSKGTRRVGWMLQGATGHLYCLMQFWGAQAWNIDDIIMVANAQNMILGESLTRNSRAGLDC
jgi:hypothetical protein